MKINLLVLLLCTFLITSSTCDEQEKYIITPKVQNEFNYYIQLSVRFVKAVKLKENSSTLRAELAEVEPDTLHKYLPTDHHKKAFWINTYNGYIQHLLSLNPELYQNRNSFFSNKQLPIAKQDLSFDDIEHGILRKSTFKWSFGYLRNPFKSDLVDQLQLENIDPRIHFALNCGAKSCPPIALYTASNFDSKVDEVAQSFLKKVSDYDATKNEVITTPLFKWFRGDFDAPYSIEAIMERYSIILKGTDPSIEYHEYDWTLSLNHYYEN